MIFIKPIDGLRAIAVVLVMLFHFAGLGSGWLGVQLFFVLSGFLITNILISSKKENFSILAELKKFYIRRTLRIFPIYYLYLSIILLSYFILNFPNYFPTFSTYLFTYTFNFTRLSSSWRDSMFFTHLWSLSLEEQIYLFWPLFTLIIKTKNLKFFYGALLILSPLFRYFFAEYLFSVNIYNNFTIGDSIYWMTFSHLDAFATGALLTLIKIDKVKKSLPKFLLIGTAFAFLIYGAINYLLTPITVNGYSYLNSFGYELSITTNYQYVFSYTLANIFFASLIFYVYYMFSNNYKCILNSILNCKILLSIGNVSYGMYLYHLAIGGFYFKYTPIDIPIIDIVIYISLVYSVSLISFNFVERYFIRLKSKFQ